MSGPRQQARSIADRARLSAAVTSALGCPDTRRALARAAGAFAVAHGLKARTILRAVHCQPLSAEGRLELCAALGVDPVTLRKWKPGDCRRLGPILPYVRAARLVHWRREKGLGLRPAASRLGVSFSTVRRAERGEKISDHALIAMCRGLDIHPHALTGTPEQAAAVGDMPMPDVSRPDTNVSRPRDTRGTFTETPPPGGEERAWERPGRDQGGVQA